MGGRATSPWGRRGELAAFLRTQRARLRPADVGLAEDQVPGRRRTPGLRREEVAQLSGVSLTWYTWLEQGRKVAASAQVLDALARALRLDPDERRHLRALAGLTTAVQGTTVEDVLPRLQRLVDAGAANLASIYDANLDYVVWNTAYARCRCDPTRLPADRRNLLWMMFTDEENRARMVRWEPAARAVLSQFRAAAGQSPDDPRHAALVARLREASPEFRRWWTEYPVRSFRPTTVTIDHPEVGPVSLDMYQLRPVEHPDLLMVMQVPTSPHDLRRIEALLS
jgi:transcriptional regulator with XRE-family HTH domain